MAEKGLFDDDISTEGGSFEPPVPSEGGSGGIKEKLANINKKLLLGVAVLVIAGGGAAVWFFVLNPAAETPVEPAPQVVKIPIKPPVQGSTTDVKPTQPAPAPPVVAQAQPAPSPMPAPEIKPAAPAPAAPAAPAAKPGETKPAVPATPTPKPAEAKPAAPAAPATPATPSPKPAEVKQAAPAVPAAPAPKPAETKPVAPVAQAAPATKQAEVNAELSQKTNGGVTVLIGRYTVSYEVEAAKATLKTSGIKYSSRTVKRKIKMNRIFVKEFADKSGAEGLISELKTKGYDPFYTRSNGKFRVYAVSNAKEKISNENKLDLEKLGYSPVIEKKDIMIKVVELISMAKSRDDAVTLTGKLKKKGFDAEIL